MAEQDCLTSSTKNQKDLFNGQRKMKTIERGGNKKVESSNGHSRVSGVNGITEDSKRGKAKGACPASPASAGAPMESANQDQE
jgi:hypothetical protein